MSQWYLGGHTYVGVGWDGPQAVRVDFVSDYLTGWHWQLYAGRKLIGVTSLPTARRVVGQLLVDDAPAQLLLLRVAAASRLTDFGQVIPAEAFHRYAIEFTVSGAQPDTHHFDITGSTAAGGSVDDTNLIARVEYRGDMVYRQPLPALATGGAWTFRVTPRDDALPLGNAGTPTDVTITAELPPADLALLDDGNRFTLAVDAGDLVAAFTY